MRANQIQPPWRFDDPHVIRRGCPSCGSTKVARVEMGLHGYSDELQEALEAGTLQLGGCMITYDIDTGHSSDPERYCNDCGTAWGRWVVYNELPAPCHGSPQKVRAWLKLHDERRAANA